MTGAALCRPGVSHAVRPTPPLPGLIVVRPHAVEHVDTGAEALFAGKTDLVLLDLGLPDLDGRGGTARGPRQADRRPTHVKGPARWGGARAPGDHTRRPSRYAIAGHPIHPMLIPFPIALSIGGLRRGSPGMADQRSVLDASGLWLVGTGAGCCGSGELPSCPVPGPFGAHGRGSGGDRLGESDLPYRHMIGSLAGQSRLQRVRAVVSTSRCPDGSGRDRPAQWSTTQRRRRRFT